MQFRRFASSNVYVAEGLSPGAGGGWAGVVLRAATGGGADPGDPDPLDLDRALRDENLGASIVVAARAPALTGNGAAALTAQVKAALPPGKKRGIVWLAATGPAPCLPIGIRDGQPKTIGTLNPSEVTPRFGLTIAVNANVPLKATDSGLALASVGGSPSWVVQMSVPVTTPQPFASKATLALTGAAAGQLAFKLALQRKFIAASLNCGFQIVIPGPAGSTRNVAAFLPLFDGSDPVPTDMFGFDVTMDYSDPTNAILPGRTAFRFDGTATRSAKPIELALASYYRTSNGLKLRLLPVTPKALVDGAAPAYLELRRGISSDLGAELYQLAPVGDFALQLDDGSPPSCRLLCGLGGTEAIELTIGGAPAKGDRLRFVSRQPAFVPVWPLPAASPIAAPIAADYSPLAADYLTSWVSIVAAADDSSPSYFSQPAGAPLFAAPAAKSGSETGPPMLDPFQPGRPWPGDESLAVPLFPYAGVRPGEQKSGPPQIDAASLTEIERSAVSPYRQRLIGDAAARMPPQEAAADGESTPSATPSGIIVQARSDGSYSEILLARTADSRSTLSFGFVNPDETLQHAFRGNSLFLVVANADHLGAAGAMAKDAGAAAFENGVTVGDWLMNADVGRNPAYGDYRSVMIVKARRGTLIDLIAATDSWNDATTFAAPSIVGPDGKPGAPDPSQIPNLAQWLSDYVAAAVGNKEDIFDNFRNIAQDESWTGVLVLAATVGTFPKDLAGMAAGIDLDRFLAHHFGVNISPVDGATVSIEGSSSVFGLINYLDPAYTLDMGEAAVPVTSTDDYDFLVLKLQALFRNSAVARFSSLAQLIVAKLFNVPVAGMVLDSANLYNAVLFDGAYQNVGGVSSYSLATTTPFAFEMASAVLSRVAITAASLDTVSAASDGDGGGSGESVFALTGFLDFAELKAEKLSFDLLSFGGQPEAPAGLAFTALKLPMNYVEKPPSRTIAFDASAIAFDAKKGGLRASSLYADLALTVDGMVSGSGGIDGAGFMPILVPQIEISSPDGDWYGIALNVDFGTPGKLGAAVGLKARLLLAWGAGGDASATPDLAAGLSLPGMSASSPLSLESVLKLSIDRIMLSRGGTNDDKARFLLTLNDIALKVLGLLKLPPDGVTNFLLFGAPVPTDGSSLGWLAMYNQDPPPAPPAPPASAAPASLPAPGEGGA